MMLPAVATACTAMGLVRLDIHDNPITAEFADDLAAVLARQGQVGKPAMLLNRGHVPHERTKGLSRQPSDMRSRAWVRRHSSSGKRISARIRPLGCHTVPLRSLQPCSSSSSSSLILNDLCWL